MTDNTTSSPISPSAATEMSNGTGFREDQLKLAISFLSSSKVQAADKSKKVAFLKSKGLTDEEITEAFKRTDQQASSNSSSSITQPAVAPSSTPPVQAPALSSEQTSPGLKFTPPPTALIPERPLEPLILYHPAPTAPVVPTRQVFALAIILGVGMTGIASSMVGIVKRLLYPVFATYAGYKHSRYKHQTTVIEKIQAALSRDIKEEEDQDELDTVDKPGVYDLVKKQKSLVDRLDRIVSQTRTVRPPSTDPASFLHHSLKDLNQTISSGMYDQQESEMVADMIRELRRVKGICLNRRHI
ncbi:hypothetical protein [Absidia glauca]|uniref:Peroxisomal membrane protein PEX14 n=1 Tax=Absidia glauca TaxID=4829 RepID=A0A163JX96_ABSGL|nr:hypothetical protein [Absidia glauca]